MEKENVRTVDTLYFRDMRFFLRIFVEFFLVSFFFPFFFLSLAFMEISMLK